MLTSGEDVQRVREAMNRSGMVASALVGGIDTPGAVLDARQICSAGLDFAYFGAESFVSDLGGVRTPNNHEVAVARSIVTMAAAAAGIGAVDQMVTDVNDSARFSREALEARSMGFGGKLCLHPSRVTLANAVFDPTEEAASLARGVDASADAHRPGGTAALPGDQMSDVPEASRVRRMWALLGGRR